MRKATHSHTRDQFYTSVHRHTRTVARLHARGPTQTPSQVHRYLGSIAGWCFSVTNVCTLTSTTKEPSKTPSGLPRQNSAAVTNSYEGLNQRLNAHPHPAAPPPHNSDSFAAAERTLLVGFEEHLRDVGREVLHARTRVLLVLELEKVVQQVLPHALRVAACVCVCVCVCVRACVCVRVCCHLKAARY